jgi:hypothetical protein
VCAARGCTVLQQLHGVRAVQSSLVSLLTYTAR